MFVTNWISTTKIQKISEITNFFRHYFLSRTEVKIDSLSLITYLPLRIAKGEMDDNNVVTYMMQGSNYDDARKQL